MVRVYTRRADAFADHAGEGLLVDWAWELAAWDWKAEGPYLRLSRSRKRQHRTALVAQWRNAPLGVRYYAGDSEGGG